MKKADNRKFRVAVLLLPILIFLIFVSVSYASNNGDIDAIVRVVPSAATKCSPNPFVVGTGEKTFTCFIEITDFPPSKIIPNTLRLSLVEKAVTPISITANSPNKIGDFDKDGIPDLKVTFNKRIVNTWFSDLYLPTDFTFKLNGEIEGVPGYVFTATDRIMVINPSYTFVHFYGNGGVVDVIKGIDFTKATVTESRIEKNAHQMIKLNKNNFVKEWEDILGTVVGKMTVRLSSGKYTTREFTAWVKYEEGDCTFDAAYTNVACVGKGVFVKRGLAVGYSRETVDIQFDTDHDTANLIATQNGVVVFRQLNVPITKFEYVVKTKSPFLFG